MIFFVVFLVVLVSCGLAAAGYALFADDSCDDMPLNRGAEEKASLDAKPIKQGLTNLK